MDCETGDESTTSRYWLKSNGTLFYNQGIDLTRKKIYYVTCTWVIYHNGKSFYSNGDNNQEAEESMMDKVKDELFRTCNEN